MKRLPFKAEHEEPVKNGTKTFTSRWGPIPAKGGHQCYKVGDIVAATAPRLNAKGKMLPAFLVSADRAFCHVEITSVVHRKWTDFTEEDAAKCGVTRDWYLKHSPPPIPELHIMTTYEFKVVSND